MALDPAQARPLLANIDTDIEDAPIPSSKRTARSLLWIRLDRPMPSERRLRWMFLALCMTLILAGINDGAQGPLLPFLQEYYSIGFLTVSYIFVTSFVGSVSAGLLNVFLTDRFGFGIVTPMGSLCQATAYAIAGTAPPFPIFVSAFTINGLGFGLQDAQANAMCSRLPDATTKISILHASFGLGATIAPFVSTLFVQHVTKAYRYYFVATAVAVFTACLLVVVFEGRTDDQVVGERTSGGGEGINLDEEEEGGSFKELQEAQGSGDKMKAILTTKSFYIMVLYSFLYVGFEVSIGGWATSYLMHVRNGTTNAGYVTAAYWGGLTISRIVLIPVTKYLGHRKAVLVYTVLALMSQISILVIPSLMVNAAAFALTGFFLGPMYPSCLMVVTEFMPGELHLGVISLMGALGGAGGAIMPFLMGALSDKFGIQILIPIVIGMMGLSLCLWLSIPPPRRK